jgi:hypothetical protein
MFRNINLVNVFERHVTDHHGMTGMPSQDRTAPSEVGERARRERHRIATYDAIQCDINPAFEALVRTGPRRHELTGR